MRNIKGNQSESSVIVGPITQTAQQGSAKPLKIHNNTTTTN